MTPDTVGSYLAGRAVLCTDDGVVAEELGGGVSGVVLRVLTPHGRLIVKRFLPELRVADHWPANPARAMTEAAALELASRLVPGSVPLVVDADPHACTVTMQCAPEGWRNWKEDLLAGRAEVSVAGRLGRYLGAWHEGTAGDAAVARRFDDTDAFEQLRVDPYYRTVMRRVPELAPVLAPYVERMAGTRGCLVHGDYSPKNVLTGDGGVWVLDWEVGHTGDPAFDVAFMTNHLALKTIHRPGAADAYRACAVAFWDAYYREVSARLAPEPAYTLGHVGCLMVARVDGKSPAEYLRGPEQHRARELGRRLAADPPAGVEDAWRLVAEAARR